VIEGQVIGRHVNNSHILAILCSKEEKETTRGPYRSARAGNLVEDSTGKAIETSSVLLSPGDRPQYMWTLRENVKAIHKEGFPTPVERISGDVRVASDYLYVKTGGTVFHVDGNPFKMMRRGGTPLRYLFNPKSYFGTSWVDGKGWKIGDGSYKEILHIYPTINTYLASTEDLLVVDGQYVLAGVHRPVDRFKPLLVGKDGEIEQANVPYPVKTHLPWIPPLSLYNPIDGSVTPFHEIQGTSFRLVDEHVKAQLIPKVFQYNNGKEFVTLAGRLSKRYLEIDHKDFVDRLQKSFDIHGLGESFRVKAVIPVDAQVVRNNTYDVAEYNGLAWKVFVSVDDCYEEVSACIVDDETLNLVTFGQCERTSYHCKHVWGRGDQILPNILPVYLWYQDSYSRRLGITPKALLEKRIFSGESFERHGGGREASLEQIRRAYKNYNARKKGKNPPKYIGVGENVFITKRIRNEDHGGWVDGMDKTIGKQGVVERISPNGTITVRFDYGIGVWSYDPRVVKLVKHPIVQDKGAKK